MRIGIFENLMTPGGHEVDFDRILVEEFHKLGHEVSFYVPEKFQFAMDYHTPVHYIPGEVVSYSGVTGLSKLLRTLKREAHRIRWYQTLYEVAERGEVDAFIVPTATYRYLRALKRSVFRKSRIPVIFILHGINPKESKKFLKAVHALKKRKRIRPTVLTLADSIFGKNPKNVHLIYPPTFTPRDIDWEPGDNALGEEKKEKKRTLTIGFFGQYRREKNLEELLEAYLAGKYERPVRLFVQGATMHPEDAEDFERIIKRYEDEETITFLHKGLLGADWQKAIAGVDALLLPYSAERYRYHWGGMLFTAIGYQKPLVTSDDMNPEVFEKFAIGKTFPSGDIGALKKTLEDFVNTYDDSLKGYHKALRKAAKCYNPATFAQHLVDIMQE